MKLCVVWPEYRELTVDDSGTLIDRRTRYKNFAR